MRIFLVLVQLSMTLFQLTLLTVVGATELLFAACFWGLGWLIYSNVLIRWQVMGLWEGLAWSVVVFFFVVFWIAGLTYALRKRLAPLALVFHAVMAGWLFDHLMAREGITHDSLLLSAGLALLAGIFSYQLYLTLIRSRDWYPTPVLYSGGDPSWRFFWRWVEKPRSPADAIPFLIVAFTLLWGFFLAPLSLALATQGWLAQSMEFLFQPLVWLYQAVAAVRAWIG